MLLVLVVHFCYLYIHRLICLNAIFHGACLCGNLGGMPSAQVKISYERRSFGSKEQYEKTKTGDSVLLSVHVQQSKGATMPPPPSTGFSGTLFSN